MDITDIWQVAQLAQAYMPMTYPSLLKDSLGYSVVAAQSNNAEIYATFCTYNYLIVNNKPFPYHYSPTNIGHVWY